MLFEQIFLMINLYVWKIQMLAHQLKKISLQRMYSMTAIYLPVIINRTITKFNLVELVIEVSN
ncbi:hypothetical protein rpr22_0438 [Rickettsia prowazekii str. Rp22]|uniref:Uncharacterized protein n=1 Tax=Rickettsia prowazekii (strain Rp22) TaxID=449216 RepID=D5AX02_RICPP|nr:hypothetical protein rpr22_0438 [Rickettsia prowazekii str. Rp22]